MYGGPFNTEEVEDVKVFYGILKVLFSFGTVFLLDFAGSAALPLYSLHTAPYYIQFDYNHKIGNLTLFYFKFNGTLTQHILLNNGLLSPLLVVLCIPLYLCFLRRFIFYSGNAEENVSWDDFHYSFLNCIPFDGHYATFTDWKKCINMHA